MSLTIPAVILGLSAAYTYYRPLFYRGTASVLIENPNPQAVNFQSEGMTNAQDVTRAYRVLAESRPVLKGAISAAGETASFESVDLDRKLPRGFESRVEGQILYFYVEDASAERAARLVNAWADAFIDEVSRRTRDSRQFVKTSLAGLKQDWIDKEDALRKFERDVGYDPRPLESHPVVKRYEELNSKLSSLNVTLAGLEAERETLLHAIQAGSAEEILQLSRARNSPVFQGHQKQLETLQAHLTEARENFREGGPEVTAAEQSLKRARLALLESARSLPKGVEFEAAQSKAERDHIQTLFNKVAAEYDELKTKSARHKLLTADAQMAEKAYSDWAQRKGDTEFSTGNDFSRVRSWARASANMALLPRPWVRNLAAALILGMLAAVALTALIERTDSTVKGPKETEVLLKCPAIGSIPLFRGRLKHEEIYRLVQSKPASPAAAALRNTQIAVLAQQLRSNAQPLVITITSPGRSEGKSFVASNLAALFHSIGRRVLVIDVGHQHSSLSRVFRCAAPPEVPSVANPEGWPQQRVHNVAPGYQLLVAGDPSQQGKCWTQPAQFARALAELKNQFDVILLDTPAVLEQADATLFAQYSDLTLLLARSRVTSLGALEQASMSLASAKRLFVLINAISKLDSATDMATCANTAISEGMALERWSAEAASSQLAFMPERNMSGRSLVKVVK
ncbi:MAG TPA: cellulose synthase operon protein YhjQ/BcsQ [Planctomycetota bacterium]